MEQEFNTKIEWDEEFIAKTVRTADDIIGYLQKQIRYLKDKTEVGDRIMAGTNLMLITQFIFDYLPRVRQLNICVGTMIGSRMFPESDFANSYLEGLHHPLTNSSYTPEKDAQEEENDPSDKLKELMSLLSNAASRGNVNVQMVNGNELMRKKNKPEDSEVNKALREKLLKEIESQE